MLHVGLIFLYVDHFRTFKFALKLSGDVEENPGSKPSPSQSFDQWNLNSISAHKCITLSLLRAHVSTHKFHVICISVSETYLNPGRSTV